MSFHQIAQKKNAHHRASSCHAASLTIRRNRLFGSSYSQQSPGATSDKHRLEGMCSGVKDPGHTFLSSLQRDLHPKASYRGPAENSSSLKLDCPDFLPFIHRLNCYANSQAHSNLPCGPAASL